MRKEKMRGKILGITFVCLVIGSMLGGLAGLADTVSAEGEYYSTKAEAVLQVPTHVTPKDCFVWKDGPDPTKPWRVIPGTGCAHWVAHEIGLGVFPSPWQMWESGEIEPPLPAEAWQVCYDGFYIRVADVIVGRTEVKIEDAKVGDIWTYADLTHTGIVRQVGDNKVLVEHCSDAQGGVVQTWFSSGKCWLATGLTGQKICIDPGHGGTDPGAVSYGLEEADVNLDVALRLRDLLIADGAIPIMTRDNDIDVSLQARCDIANNNNCDRFVSIHCNAFDGTAKGTETYCHPRGDSFSFDLRDKVNSEVVSHLGTRVMKRCVAPTLNRSHFCSILVLERKHLSN